MPHPLSTLINLGPSMVRHLSDAGIDTVQELEKVGYMEAYLRLKFINPKVMGNRMALYALYGALTHQNCMKLPSETKALINAELEEALLKKK